tara:strand:- start:407 stop:898 length:492 start_codon:yes stop_codon:yes gene_type:complete
VLLDLMEFKVTLESMGSKETQVSRVSRVSTELLALTAYKAIQVPMDCKETQEFRATLGPRDLQAPLVLTEFKVTLEWTASKATRGCRVCRGRLDYRECKGRQVFKGILVFRACRVKQAFQVFKEKLDCKGFRDRQDSKEFKDRQELMESKGTLDFKVFKGKLA